MFPDGFQEFEDVQRVELEIVERLFEGKRNICCSRAVDTHIVLTLLEQSEEVTVNGIDEDVIRAVVIQHHVTPPHLVLAGEVIYTVASDETF
jgi:hypothetical protein